MGENQCPHCGRVVTGFEQLDLVHKQACDAAKAATITRLEAERREILDERDGFKQEKERLAAENARLLGLFGGLTLRDWFAGMALAEVPDPLTDADAPTTARLAYAIADAMITHRSALASAQPAGEAPKPRFCICSFIIPPGRECDCDPGACKASGLGPTWPGPAGEASPDEGGV